MIKLIIAMIVGISLERSQLVKALSDSLIEYGQNDPIGAGFMGLIALLVLLVLTLGRNVVSN